MGKHIVITGVSRGLGRAMVDGFIAAGHTVSGCARSADAVAQLAAQYPAPHQFTAMDIRDDAAVAAWAQAAIAANGLPDLVINNAGLVNHPAPLWAVPAEECDAVIAVNLNGTCHVIRHFAPPMVEQRSGIFVNFSSGWGRSTSPGVAPYCATKWGVEGLTQSLSQDLPPGMAAVALNPGIIHTDMLVTCYGDDAAAYTPIATWAKAAVPYILSLHPGDNGRALTVPG
ncbi:SDR family oxidoreductase [Nodosilinea sp. LEGE 07088]|uniref:SDR family oxidoreductase n=1 Tax=Nodosilinea sp. LEGE 07088 TaxID=2777968 RepID=UPI001882D582|nr:SDR family oxidoreductase [Nodosilinea sp. LEGE 07088]MBE9138354.1 SDR family oxidoreductase [Nodosilinea sp. LEGE 07088]